MPGMIYLHKDTQESLAEARKNLESTLNLLLAANMKQANREDIIRYATQGLDVMIANGTCPTPDAPKGRRARR